MVKVIFTNKVYYEYLFVVGFFTNSHEFLALSDLLWLQSCPEAVIFELEDAPLEEYVYRFLKYFRT